MLHVQVIRGPNAGEEIRTSEMVVRIGKADGCRLRLSKENTTASKLHGELSVTRDGCFYRDLLSKNGTTIRKADGRRVELTSLLPEWEVNAGDEIVIGANVLKLVDVEVESGRVEVEGDLTENWGARSCDVLQAGESWKPTDNSLIEKFLQLADFDPTDLQGTKLRLLQVLLELYPHAHSVALVEVRPSGEPVLKRQDIDTENALVRDRDGQTSKQHYSFSVLQEAHRQRSAIGYSSAQALPISESVSSAGMGSCMCAPLLDGVAIVGFLQAYTTRHEQRSFRRTDLPLFGLLSSIASLLIRQARVAKEKAEMRLMASVGQVVAGLSHDARNILQSLGAHAGAVERRLPELVSDRSWGYVREDLEMLHTLTQDSLDQITATTRPLELTAVKLHEVVESVLSRCRRYFLDGTTQDSHELINQCPVDLTAVTAVTPLSVALMNAVKNALDAYRDRPSAGTRRLIVSGREETDENGTACVLSIVDDAGGVPSTILARLGQSLVTTKGQRGTGLGMRIVIDSVARLKGRVVLATATKSSLNVPAGTVMSLYIPKNVTDKITASSSLVLTPDYVFARQVAIAAMKA